VAMIARRQAVDTTRAPSDAAMSAGSGDRHTTVRGLAVDLAPEVVDRHANGFQTSLPIESEIETRKVLMKPSLTESAAACTALAVNESSNRCVNDMRARAAQGECLVHAVSIGFYVAAGSRHGFISRNRGSCARCGHHGELLAFAIGH